MPKFLEDKPTNKNTLGETHKKLSETLKNIIDNLSDNHSVKNIIGLFGDWGSGKSSIIEMVRRYETNPEKENENYKVFEFDSWSHKDEFLKKAFLIELTKDLGYKDKSLGNIGFPKKGFEKINTIDYLSKKNLVKTITNETDTPKSFIFVIIFFILFFNFIGISLFDFIPNKIKGVNINLKAINFTGISLFDFIPNEIKRVNINLKAIIGIISLLFIIIIFLLNKEEFKNLYNLLVFKKVNFNETLISSENQDFSNYDYQEYFQLIVKKYLEENENRKLVIVLDNLDRVNDDIVLNSISLIQTTLEGIKDEKDNNGKNIFERLIFILPIDKDRLKKVFEKLIKDDLNDIEKNNFTEGFINKTFSVIVDIPSLEQSNWRTYFKEKFEEAFGKDQFKEIDIEYIVSGFYLGIKTNNKSITPREIINFINELVSNYLYFNDNINLKYQGIYILLKRYYPKFLKEIIWKKENNKKEINKTYIKEAKKLNKNEILRKLVGNNYKDLLEDLLKQVFKTDNVYNLIYLDVFIEEIKNGNTEKIDKLLDEIDNYDKEKNLLENAYLEIEQIKDIDILGKIAKVIFESKNEALSFYKKNILDLIKENLENLKNIDKRSSEGILKILNEYDNKQTEYIKENLPTILIKTIILSNKTKEKDE